MFIVYTPYTVYKYGMKGWCKLIVHDGWKYLILTLGDFEAGYLYIKAFGYTDLMSCMLLDAWTIPVCMLACWAVMHVRYHWTQVLGVVICIGGLALLVTSDLLTGKNGDATRSGEGDGFMLAASTLYGFVNAVEEFLIRRSPLYEARPTARKEPSARGMTPVAFRSWDRWAYGVWWRAPYNPQYSNVKSGKHLHGMELQPGS